MSGDDSSTIVIPEELDILPLFGIVIYPQTVTPMAIGRPDALRLLEGDGGRPRLVGVVALRSEERRPEAPGSADCFTVGTAALVHRLLRLPDGTLRVAVQGLARFRWQATLVEQPALRAQICLLDDPEVPAAGMSVVLAQLRELAGHAPGLIPGFSRELLDELALEQRPDRLLYPLAQVVLARRNVVERQHLLELGVSPGGAELLATMLIDELERMRRLVQPPPPPVISGPAQVGRALWARRGPAGSGAMLVEAALRPGGRSLIITGAHGHRTRDAAQLALAWLRGKADQYGIDPQFYMVNDLYINIMPQTPDADGASAGFAMLVALASLLTGRPVAAGVALAGTLTLYGELLAVGAPGERIAAARAAGVGRLIIAAADLAGLALLNTEDYEGIEVVGVSRVEEALAIALTGPGS